MSEARRLTSCVLQCTRCLCIRGAIKKFSASSRPDVVLFRIKLKYYWLRIVARLRTRHSQYDFWAVNILCILAVVGSLHSTWKKWELHSVMKMTILTNSFVPLHALLFWLRFKVVDAYFILKNELWNKFLLGHVGIVLEVLKNLCAVLVLAFSTSSDRHCVHTLKGTKYL